MFHIKSVIPKVINKIKLKDDSKESPQNSAKDNKNTSNQKVFLNQKNKKTKSVSEAE